MDKSDLLHAVQLRFRDAAEKGEGLHLSPDEVALLYSLEEQEDSPPPPLEPIAEDDTYSKVLALITPSNPFTFNQNGINSPVVWSLFLTWLRAWANEGHWTFSGKEATVLYNGIKHVTPLSRQLELPLNHNGKTTNHQPIGSAEAIQGSTGRHGERGQTPTGHLR